METKIYVGTYAKYNNGSIMSQRVRVGRKVNPLQGKP